MKRLFAATMLGIATLTPAQARDAVRAAPDPKAAADALVAMLVSDDAMITLGNRAFDTGVYQRLARDAALKQVYETNAALKAHVVGTLRGEFVKILKRELPSLRRQLSMVVTTDMTPVEISDTLTFFSSPLGQKIKGQVYRSIGDGSGQDQAAIQQSTMAAVMSGLAPEDYPALMAFGSSSAAQKMQRINPKIASTSQAWANQVVAVNEATMRAKLENVTADYLKARK